MLPRLLLPPAGAREFPLGGRINGLRADKAPSLREKE